VTSSDFDEEGVMSNAVARTALPSTSRRNFATVLLALDAFEAHVHPQAS
jgi:hypothetical protein